MDIKDLKQIIELMKRSELTELEIEEASLKLRLRRESGAIASTYTEPTVIRMPQPALEAPAAAPILALAPSAPAEDKNVVVVKSPMVGTFYRSPSPESSAFVQIGSQVSSESVVCIIEAMKVLNEIHAETTGSIIEVLVENGQSVEFGQPLFKVKP
jgi:acetyl-CoA carboxylase biotin carboxyl carrier protein